MIGFNIKISYINNINYSNNRLISQQDSNCIIYAQFSISPVNQLRHKSHIHLRHSKTG